MPEAKHMSLYDVDINVAAKLLMDIARHWPESDVSRLALLASAIATDIVYWRKKRESGKFLVSEGIRSRREYVNKTLFEMYRKNRTVPMIQHQETPGAAAPHVLEVATKEAEACYRPTPAMAPKLTGLPLKNRILERRA